MESWCEWSQESDEPCNDPEAMIDIAADTLAFSNVHFMNTDTRCQISQSDRDVVHTEILRLLNLPFQNPE